MELFHSRGVAVAPLSVSRKPVAAAKVFDLVGVMSYSTTSGNGRATLCLEPAVYGLLVGQAPSPAAEHDVLRELTNQLVGRIKNRLMQFQMVLRIGLPSAMSPDAMRRQRPPSTTAVTYSFRTLRGEVAVTIDGGIDEEALSYSSAIHIPKEGEFIAF